MGTSYWQKAYEERENIENLNQEFVEKTEDIVTAMMWIMIVLGVILDLLICKFSSLNKIIIYFELIMTIIYSMVPFEYGGVANIGNVLNTIMTAYAYSNHTRRNFVAVLLTTAIIQFNILPILYNIEINAIFFLVRFLDVFIVFIFCYFFRMFLVYIAILRGDKDQLMIENMKLIDKMHEGIIVVSEKDHDIKFANKPAISLLKQVEQKESLNHEIPISIMEGIEQEFLDKKMFKLTKIEEYKGDVKSSYTDK